MRYNKICWLFFLVAVAFSCENGGSDLAAPTQTGQGGSMTRFAINGNYLYVVDNQSIDVFNLVDGEFQRLNTVAVSFGMETIFARGEYLYLGATDAMYIFSIAEPDKPTFVFRYQHIVSCDPVVVQGNRAYVTLRSGSFCNRGTNALEIIDISNPYQPTLISNFGMLSPHGLGIDGNLLFLCEGEYGLKVFDVSDDRAIKLIQHRDDFFAYDVIAREGVATVTGEDGIFQFSYADPQQPAMLLSKIPVSRTEF